MPSLPLPPPLTVWDIPPACRSTDSVTCGVVWDWTHNRVLSHAAAWLIGKPLAVVVLLVLGFVVRWLAHRFIDRLVAHAQTARLPAAPRVVAHTDPSGRHVVDGHRPSRVGDRRAQRAQSLGSLAKSTASGVVYGVVFVMVLSTVGINIAPILASAGVLGLAIGFGAQSLVADFFAGVSMMVEDQYGVGDIVDLGEAVGTVEAVGLRVTRVRDVEGTVWYVRNGQIERVGNQSQNWARTVLDVTVGYQQSLSRVRDLLREVARGMWQDEQFRGVILEEPEVWGVQALTPEAITLRVVIKTAPSQQWAVAREMRARVKDIFDERGIEMPSPTRLFWESVAQGKD